MFEAVTATDWESWVAAADAVVLDCREPGEWARGTIPGSTLVSVADIPESLHAFDSARPVLAVCRTGSRSSMVARFLLDRGFARVGNLEGGLVALGIA